MRRFDFQQVVSTAWRPYLANMSWLLAGRGIRLLMGFFVGIWVARYLGPSRYGMLNFAMSLVTIAAAVSHLGLDQILVRERVRHPEDREVLFGTAFILRTAGLLAAYGMLALAVEAMSVPDETVALVWIASVTLAFQLISVVDVEYQARVEARYSVSIRTTSLMLASLMRVVAILAGASLMVFVWLLVVEQALLAAGWWLLATHHRYSPWQWRFDSRRARQLWGDSWPLWLGGAAMAITLRVDQVMIQTLLGEDALGQYAAAVRISDLLYFLPLTGLSTFFPPILRARDENTHLYHQRLDLFYSGMIWMGLVLALLFSLTALPLTRILFGPAFAQTGSVLTIHVWSLVFVCMGHAGSRWFLAENHQRLLTIIHLLAAILNVVLNLWWLPAMGIRGAALATLASYGVAGYAGNFMFKVSRENGLRLTTALNPVPLARLVIRRWGHSSR
jgi:O-antigen/teichoic acid export membrane protein